VAPTAARRAWGRAVKRAFDLSGAGLLLLVFLPVVAVVAVVIKVDSRGPVFYRCRRVGQGGRDLRMLKFRKMTDGATGPALTCASDPRLTRVGRFLAKTKLDEIPQLWNVVRGEMSLVGPRPEDPSFVALGGPTYQPILDVKPGITGLSQLAFAKETDILARFGEPLTYEEHLLPQKMAIDSLYAQRRTLRMDGRILWWTAVVLLLRKDVAVDRQTGALRLRKRARGRELAPAEALMGP
jgi:lipopolysaccharide/colanic/teichoic acid biosynthesis glycosyltransferase